MSSGGQDSESLRVMYEGAVKHNPNNIDAVYYLAVWHLERQSFQLARRYFSHLATLRSEDVEVWLCLCVCCALAEEYSEANTALIAAKKINKTTDGEVRVRFCQALLAEKKKDFPAAMEGYTNCLNQCSAMANVINNEHINPPEVDKTQKITFLKEVRGEVMLRIAMLKKEMGAIDQAMQMCNTITSEPFSDAIRANALCLKGLLHEVRGEFPTSEVVYRSVLHLKCDHCSALERLGRVYLRYRETIPAAVQCFFKAVETNPSNHVAWYLLGRCYMATSQFTDACEAYNRAINLNPNDPQIWCSLGVLYYAFGQYKEALGMLSRALKLDPTMADAWYNVGALYDMCDQPDDAHQAYIKAKENGLADRFTKAGMGLNPVAMQSLQYVNATTNSNLPPTSSASSAGGLTQSPINSALATAATANVNAAAAALAAVTNQRQQQQLQQQQQQQQLRQMQQAQHQAQQQQFFQQVAAQQQQQSQQPTYSQQQLLQQIQLQQQLQQQRQQFSATATGGGVSSSIGQFLPNA